MSDLTFVANWPSVAIILLVLIIAGLVGPGRRPSPVAEPANTNPWLDLSLWLASGSLPSSSWPMANGQAPFCTDLWAGYYDQQFAELKRRLSH